MATISPARQSRETRFSARRRPNVRVTSENVSDVKSMRAGSGRRFLVELGVDPLEGADELPASRHVPILAEGAGALLLFDAGEVGKEAIAPGGQFLASVAARPGRTLAQIPAARITAASASATLRGQTG